MALSTQQHQCINKTLQSQGYTDYKWIATPF